MEDLTIPAWMVSAVRDKQNGMSADQFKLLALVIAHADEVRESPDGQRWAVYHGDLAQLPGAPSSRWFSQLRNREDMLEKGYLASEARPVGQRGRSWTVRLTCAADLKPITAGPVDVPELLPNREPCFEPRAGLTVVPSTSSSSPPVNLRALLVNALADLGVREAERVVSAHGTEKCSVALAALVEALYDPCRKAIDNHRDYVMGIILGQRPWFPVSEYTWLDHWFQPQQGTCTVTEDDAPQSAPRGEGSQSRGGYAGGDPN